MAEPTLYKNAAVFWSTATNSAAATQIPDVKSLEFPLSKAELANSVMGDGMEAFFPGLISAPITVVARQAFGTGSLDAECFSRWDTERKFRLKFRAVNSAVAAGNPSYILNRVGMFAYRPLGGQHGQLLENTIQLRALSGCTVARSTTT